MKNKKVIVALSGGKDSTTAVILLKEQNYDVHAVTMKLGLEEEEKKIRQIENLTGLLKVPFSTIDMRDVFQKKVIDYFVESYAAGLTPNPCTVCNIEIKFDLLMNRVLLEQQADYYATGHYAKKIEIDGRFFLTEPEDRNKSQIYFLSMIGSKALEKVLFPIADIPIEKVRETVKELPLANKEESQDVCFLHNGRLMDFLRERLPSSYFREGDILDVEGNKIGRHKGAVYFTIGQRRGTNFASDRKLYVIKKDVQKNTITLGDEEHLYSQGVKVIKAVFWRPVKVGEVFAAKFRYMSPFYKAVITGVSETGLSAEFEKPVKSITPGQVAAFYDKDIIAAAGFIK